jgi:hypothetical protein
MYYNIHWFTSGQPQTNCHLITFAINQRKEKRHVVSITPHHWGREITNLMVIAGADPGFQVRGVALKKIAPNGGRRENFGGISCEKSRFYAKKNHIFSNFRGGGRAPGAPPLDPPLDRHWLHWSIYIKFPYDCRHASLWKSNAFFSFLDYVPLWI